MAARRAPTLARELLTLWLPASLQYLTDWSRPLLFNIFVSRNVKDSSLDSTDAVLEMDAVGLAVMSLNLLLFATAYGFNGAIDSYASVAYGAGDVRELRAVLLRQAVLLCGLSILAVFMFANAESAFKLIGLSGPLATRSAQLLQLMSWAVPGDFAYDAIGRWLRGQQLHRLVACCSLSALALNITINVAAADKVDPTRAPLLALIAQNTYLPFALLGAYAGFGPNLRGGKEGGSTSMTQLVFGPELVRQLRTGLAAMVWTCAELWAWELQVFEASALGEGNAAAYTLLSSTYSLLITAFPVSVASAASALIGEALGRHEPARATRVLHAACTLTLIMLVCYTLPVGAARATLAELLSGGAAEVAVRYERVLPLILSMHFLDGIFNVLKQWLTVRKKQAFGALMSLVIYYGFGVPLGYWLAFHGGWGMLGLWAGLGASVSLGCVTTALQAVHDIETSLKVTHTDDESNINEDGEEEFVYVAFNPADSVQGPPAKLPRRLAACGSVAIYRLRLLVYVAPGMVLFMAYLISQAPRPSSHAEVLNGAAPCVWSTGGDTYDYPFTAFFSSVAGSYGWEVTLARQGRQIRQRAMRRLHVRPLGVLHAATRWLGAVQLMKERDEDRTPGDLLRLGHTYDVYDETYTRELDPRVEVGWAVWIHLPEIRGSEDEEEDGWTSRAFVGTRISTANHTFCGCQFMRGGRSSFRLTEHGRAQIEFATPSSSPWYLNLTRRKINEQIEATCRPFASQACPVDNETAYHEWATSKDNGTFWTVKPWVEIYSSLPE